MDAIKLYFKQECKLLMLALEHPKPSDFYISVWQATRSPVPLLIWRALLFLTSIGIVITSVTFYAISSVSLGYWFIYLTHWGLTLMILSTGFGFAVSLRTYISGPLSVDYSLPWYVKTFWVLHNMSVPVAFLITLFYWTILYEAGVSEEMNLGLDVSIHGINSVVMFLLLSSSSHPSRLVHVLHPMLFALTYVAFSLIYYLAGGVDTAGNRYVYPVLYWGSAGKAFLVVVITGLLLIVLHFATIGLAAARDAIANRLIRPSVTVHVDERLALRRPTDNV
ncbi:protein rolling stone-like [Aricia agestis]|uniref:protein rolling stone-like n=1 Tax=Aricia agestis TaxID=91739 RepID=UPI001C203583|nr:protein rolling stone-like [Aricia agestis]